MCVPQEDLRQLQVELSACREQLKATRAESARRQRALQLMQGLPGQQQQPGLAGTAAGGVASPARPRCVHACARTHARVCMCVLGAYLSLSRPLHG